MSFADAVSVASAIVQLVQFSSSIISGARQFYNNAQLKEHAELDLIQADLDAHLQNIAKREPEASQLGLQELASMCRQIGLELKDALQKLKAREGSTRISRMGRSVGASLSTILSKDKVKALQQRLEAVRDEIQFKLVVLISNQTEEFVSTFAITHDQLLDMSDKAAQNAEEFKRYSSEQYLRMTDMEKRMLDTIATQNHKLHEVAEMLSAESKLRHDETREEMRSVGSDITHQNVEQHNITRESIGVVDTSVQRVYLRMDEQRDVSIEHNVHLSRVEDSVSYIKEQIGKKQEDDRKEVELIALRERKKRRLDAINKCLHPVDQLGRPIKLTEGQAAARFAMAATLVSLYWGTEVARAMRGPDGRIKLPIDANKMPEFKFSQIKIPKIDFGKIKAPQIDTSEVRRTFDMVGGHIQQTSVAGFTATRNMFLGIPKFFQPVAGTVTVETGEAGHIDHESDRKVMLIELVDEEDMENIPPPQPPRPGRSSPRIAPKPPHLRSLHSAATVDMLTSHVEERSRRASNLL